MVARGADGIYTLPVAARGKHATHKLRAANGTVHRVLVCASSLASVGLTNHSPHSPLRRAFDVTTVFCASLRVDTSV